MSVRPVISNTSPLIGLFKINRLSLFRDLYTEVWIPREVEKEFLAVDDEVDKAIHQKALQSAPWIKVVDLTNPQSAPNYPGIDAGEAEVFALADEHKARLILLDEKRGRRRAEGIGLTVKGTVGILLEAKQKGLIDFIKPLLIQLQNNGMHLSESVINKALRDAGEAENI